jgi:hypothetical protein
MQVRRVESRPDGFIVSQIGLDAQSNPTSIQTTYKLDGKEYPEYTQTTLAAFAATSRWDTSIPLSTAASFSRQPNTSHPTGRNL